MKKICSILLMMTLAFGLTGYSSTASAAEEEKKILVAYFSRAGENYDVGTIEKGNTRIVAEMIADELNQVDLFEIAKEDPYPESYEETKEIAEQEKEENARPELNSSVEHFEDYDIVFIGYPIWHGDMPMPEYTFLESYDFSDKTVIPFCTHAGSGLAATEQTKKDKLADAVVLSGLAVKGTDAQNNQSEVEDSVLEWLKDIVQPEDGNRK